MWHGVQKNAATQQHIIDSDFIFCLWPLACTWASNRLGWVGFWVRVKSRAAECAPLIISVISNWCVYIVGRHANAAHPSGSAKTVSISFGFQFYPAFSWLSWDISISVYVNSRMNFIRHTSLPPSFSFPFHLSSSILQFTFISNFVQIFSLLYSCQRVNVKVEHEEKYFLSEENSFRFFCMERERESTSTVSKS